VRIADMHKAIAKDQMIHGADIHLRKAPVGRKGKATVDRIIDGAAEVLEARGYEALTTNHIAEAAGVNIATLYKYFANKQAILVALTDRRSGLWKEVLGRGIDQIHNGVPWRKAVCETIDAGAERRKISSGAAAIRTALQVSPELQLLNRDTTIEAGSRVADMLIACAGVDAVTAARVGRVAIEVGMACLDLLLNEKPADYAALVDEAKAVVCNYLAPYFEDRTRL
jgi:AcrR family transcriptional regulator